MSDEPADNIDGDKADEPQVPKGPVKPMPIDVVKKSLSKLTKTYGKY